MLLDELAGYPDDGDGIEARSVGDDLAEVRVVGLRELVLDEHPLFAQRIPAEDVRSEGANALLR